MDCFSSQEFCKLLSVPGCTSYKINYGSIRIEAAVTDDNYVLSVDCVYNLIML